MAKSLYGKPLADVIAADLSRRVAALRRPPTLAVISVGDRQDSASYIAAKERFAARIGARVVRAAFPASASRKDVEAAIDKFAAAPEVDGIIVQLPLPGEMDKNELIERIPPKKDVDGLSAANLRRLLAGTPRVIPATARGVCNLLSGYGISVAGSRIAVVGRSLLVGKSIALALVNKDATVTLCHRRTKDLEKVTKASDIIVVAAGSPGLITRKHVVSRHVVVDVGISVTGEQGELGERSFQGDVDADAVGKVVSALSPVPGGVGPMTVSALFENLVEAAERGAPAEKRRDAGQPPSGKTLF